MSVQSKYGVFLAEETLRVIQEGMSDKFRSFRRLPMQQVGETDLPVLGVYILRERRRTTGDGGPPSFINELTLGISGGVRLEDHDEEQPRLDLDEWMSDIDDLLFTNAAWVKLSENVLSTDRTSQYSKEGEISMAEVRVEMVLQFRTSYEPVVPDMLETVRIKTSYPHGGASEEERAKWLQVDAEIDVPTE